MESLGQRLREVRVEAGLTGRDLGRRAGWHSSKVSKIEHARQTPSIVDIRAWCRHCGADDQAADLIAVLRAVESMFVQWKRLERPGLRHAQAMVLPLWQRTTRFRAYTCRIVPGILQTREYTTVTLAAITRHRSVPDDVAPAVGVRMDKQTVLHDAHRRFALVIEEAVLRHRIGPPEVMAGQLGHLLTVMSLPTVSLSIVPAGIERSRWAVEDFWIFDGERVHVELVSGWLTVTAPHEVAMYVQAHQELSAMAVTGKPARDLIVSALAGLS